MVKSQNVRRILGTKSKNSWKIQSFLPSDLIKNVICTIVKGLFRIETQYCSIKSTLLIHYITGMNPLGSEVIHFEWILSSTVGIPANYLFWCDTCHFFFSYFLILLQCYQLAFCWFHVFQIPNRFEICELFYFANSWTMVQSLDH